MFGGREREMVTVWGVSSLERQRAESLQINATILSGTVIIHSMQPQFPQSRERWSQCGFPHYRGRGLDHYMLWQSWVWNYCIYLGEILLLLRGLFYNSALQIELACISIKMNNRERSKNSYKNSIFKRSTAPHFVAFVAVVAHITKCHTLWYFEINVS